jgi:TusA-related sulfurtransferase
MTFEKRCDQSVDFSGVSCPLKDVRTKMSLARLRAGQILSVLLDHQVAKNVPASAAADGYDVIAIETQERHWRVLPRKKEMGRN